MVILGSLAAPDGIHYQFFSPVNIHALQLNKPVGKIRFFYRNTQFLFNFEAFWSFWANFGLLRPVFRLIQRSGPNFFAVSTLLHFTEAISSDILRFGRKNFIIFHELCIQHKIGHFEAVFGHFGSLASPLQEPSTGFWLNSILNTILE